jgi:hypothetical protein
MTLEVTNPLIDFNFIEENDASPSTDCTTPTKLERASSISTKFFEGQVDLNSEIISFLDVKSLLAVCQTTKAFSSCLRHDHVIASVMSRRPAQTSLTPLTTTLLTTTSLEASPSMLATYGEKKEADFCPSNDKNCHFAQQQTPEAMILKRLLQVFEGYSSLKNSQNAHVAYSITIQNIEQPSPMRLLRLVNGKKCERCNCKLSASSGACGSTVLPSLTFAKFCCTKCFFE